MTNFEKWKDELLRLGKDGQDGIACLNGKPIPCVTIDDCCNCDFNKDSCDGKFLLWLYEEYEEPKPKLTKREWHFLNFIESGYIARDAEGELVWYREKPYTTDNFGKLVWDTNGDYDDFIYFDFHKMFKFINWRDAEPWKVEDLLELEVEK